MLWGSVILAATALLSGETRGFSFAAVTAESWYSVLYLIIFGSLVGYTSYIYVLKHATPAVTSTYAYVNPVVAVFLGWAINNEPVHTTTLIAAGLIVVAVIMISLKKRA
jgi:drug/metabolite transporter (DMT)-like permease